MRNTARIGVVAAAIVALALVLTGCAVPSDKGGPDPGLRGQWQLMSGTDATGTIPLANQLISLTINGDSTTTGRSTCSDYTARVYGSLSQLWVTAKLPREQHCGTQVQQDIEQRYISDLNKVRTSTLTGGVLDLLAPGIDLKFHKALAIPLNLVIGHHWKLATVSADSYYATQAATPVDTTGATLYFSEDGILIGTTGCRQFTANYAENAGEIVVRKYTDLPTGPCDETAQASDTYVISVVRSGFTFLSGFGELALASPRAEIALGFIN